MITTLTLQIDSSLLSALQHDIPIPDNEDPQMFLSSLATDRLRLYYGLISPLGSFSNIQELTEAVSAEFSAFAATAPRKMPFSTRQASSSFRHIPTIWRKRPNIVRACAGAAVARLIKSGAVPGVVQVRSITGNPIRDINGAAVFLKV